MALQPLHRGDDLKFAGSLRYTWTGRAQRAHPERRGDKPHFAFFGETDYYLQMSQI